MSAYVLTPLAKADLFDIWTYIADNSEPAADRVEQAIQGRGGREPARCPGGSFSCSLVRPARRAQHLHDGDAGEDFDSGLAEEAGDGFVIKIPIERADEIGFAGKGGLDHMAIDGVADRHGERGVRHDQFGGLAQIR